MHELLRAGFIQFLVLPIVYFLLFGSYFLVLTSYFLLVYFLIFTFYFLLFTFYFLLSVLLNLLPKDGDDDKAVTRQVLKDARGPLVASCLISYQALSRAQPTLL